MSSTILVTGGAGFVGSNLIRHLVAEAPDTAVISLDNYFTGTPDNHLDHPQVTYLDACTIDIDKVWQDRGLPSPETVYHLGEYSRIVQSFDEGDLTWEFNLRGTKEVVHFAQRHGAKLVYAGSSSKFGNEGADEHLNPYAWTKAKNVEYIRNYATWYGLDYAITYFYNVYGPRQITEGKYATVIGIFERQYLAGEALTVVSPGTQTRDFTHIDDIVAGVVRCAREGRGDGYMLGTGREWPIIEVAQMFGAPYALVPALPGERTRGRADTSQARGLGWAPARDLPKYIREFRAAHPRD
ncbi:NAD dependent epimerase/dehydratase [Pilimelia terevasa]|uniref:NAD dependent epimerase/dehydratase n=1 Tax=Pilimelia terevasa TaxID=53372 RepID=A0A8J3FJG0_9ACTN|nr:NAD-dependent epimerase/dehydratase family protein [Pilimelia terevasa]GGK39917.1 NAD dependent epimerase/dehydratase [Pilimelia terevasa]